jgi:hypothetical protein
MITKVISIFLFFFLPIGVVAGTEVFWVGSKQQLENSSLRGSIKTVVSQPRKSGVNIRSVSPAGRIQVFNRSNSLWIESEYTLSPHSVISESDLSEFKNLSECKRVADLILEVKNSTPSADIFADGFKAGMTSSSGDFKNRIATVCLKSVCRVELRKAPCISLVEDVEVKTNPFTDVIERKLICP